MPRTLLLLTLLAIATTASAQWQLQDAHTTADLRGIDNVGGGVAWASGTDGTILRTEDAGFVWQLCAKPPNAEHLDFRAIQAFDNNTAIVMSSGKGDLSRLYKTTDGCQSWKLLFTDPDKDGFWDALQLQNRGNPNRGPGWLLGDPVDGRYVLMGTLDGGLNWTRVETDDLTAPTPTTGAFAASNSALIFLSVPSFVTGGPGGAYFYRGDSVCTSLIAQNSRAGCIAHSTRFDRTRIPINGDTASAGGFSVAQSHDVIVLVGGDYTKPTERNGTAAYFNSYFGGWFAAKTLPGGYRSAVAYDDKTDTWITVGPNGTDISTDDGRNWHPLKPNPAFNDPPDADQHWNAISLPFAVGPHGRIATLRPSALAPPSK